MLYGDLHKHVRKAFGIRQFMPFGRNEELTETGETAPFTILYHWIAEVNCFQPAREDDELVIAIVKTQEWLRGLILLPLAINPELNKPVTLSDWDDPIPDALKGVNVFPEPHAAVRFGEGSYTYGLECHTLVAGGSVRVSMAPAIDETLNHLGKCIIQTVHHVAKVYDKEDINRYLNLVK